MPIAQHEKMKRKNKRQCQPGMMQKKKKEHRKQRKVLQMRCTRLLMYCQQTARRAAKRVLDYSSSMLREKTECKSMLVKPTLLFLGRHRLHRQDVHVVLLSYRGYAERAKGRHLAFVSVGGQSHLAHSFGTTARSWPLLLDSLAVLFPIQPLPASLPFLL